MKMNKNDMKCFHVEMFCKGLWSEATGFLFGGFDSNRLKERLYQDRS